MSIGRADWSPCSTPRSGSGAVTTALTLRLRPGFPDPGLTLARLEADQRDLLILRDHTLAGPTG